jgi:hypothetical protein
MSFAHAKTEISSKTPEMRAKSIFQTEKAQMLKPTNSLADNVLHLQNTIGNQAVQRLIESGCIQAKLRIGQPNDAYEMEADRMADAVMRIPEPKTQRYVEEKDGGQSKLLVKRIAPMVQRQATASVPVVNVNIQRDQETDQATLGTISVGGHDLQVLELPNRGNAATGNYQTAGRIPAGTYQAHVRTDGSLGWRLELDGVPNRANIQIHVGNTPEQTVGCILPGTSSGQNRVNNSAEAINQIRQVVENAGSGATIQVTVTDPPTSTESEATIHPKESPNHTVDAGAEPVMNSFRDGGKPLPEPTLALFDQRFSYDFSQVRIHTDAKAAESARMINALAYTVGRDIVFGSGQYAPGTTSGMRLLAHELVHTMQQRTQEKPVGKSLLAQRKAKKEILPVVDWKTLYKQCCQKVFAKRNTLSWGGRRVPPLGAIDLILQVTTLGAGEYGPEDLAAVWAIESNFASYPKNHLNSNGSVDIGPVQINYQAHSPGMSETRRIEVFGSNLSGGETFNGSPSANLAYGWRYLLSRGHAGYNPGSAARSAAVATLRLELGQFLECILKSRTITFSEAEAGVISVP